MVKNAHPKWYEEKGEVMVILGVLFILTVWNRFVLALILLPLIYSIKKGNKISIVLTGIYSGFLTLVNMSVYIENNRNQQGNFETSSAMPILVFLLVYVFLVVYLIQTYKHKIKIQGK